MIGELINQRSSKIIANSRFKCPSHKNRIWEIFEYRIWRNRMPSNYTWQMPIEFVKFNKCSAEYNYHNCNHEKNRNCVMTNPSLNQYSIMNAMVIVTYSTLIEMNIKREQSPISARDQSEYCK